MDWVAGLTRNFVAEINPQDDTFLTGCCFPLSRKFIWRGHVPVQMHAIIGRAWIQSGEFGLTSKSWVFNECFVFVRFRCHRISPVRNEAVTPRDHRAVRTAHLTETWQTSAELSADHALSATGRRCLNGRLTPRFLRVESSVQFLRTALWGRSIRGR